MRRIFIKSPFTLTMSCDKNISRAYNIFIKFYKYACLFECLCVRLWVRVERSAWSDIREPQRRSGNDSAKGFGNVGLAVLPLGAKHHVF